MRTGLVKSLGWWDSFGVGFGGVVLGVAMTSFYYVLPATLPRANLIGSLLFLLIVSCAIPDCLYSARFCDAPFRWRLHLRQQDHSSCNRVHAELARNFYRYVESTDFL